MPTMSFFAVRPAGPGVVHVCDGSHSRVGGRQEGPTFAHGFLCGIARGEDGSPYRVGVYQARAFIHLVDG